MLYMWYQVWIHLQWISCGRIDGLLGVASLTSVVSPNRLFQKKLFLASTGGSCFSASRTTLDITRLFNFGLMNKKGLLIFFHSELEDVY